MENYILYGDGIHDDLPYIQNELNNNVSELYLPNPKKCYMISGAIKMHSNQTLRLGKTTVIKLMDNTNTEMARNDDFNLWSEHICIDGGIWDMNNLNQRANPFWVPDENGRTAWDDMGVKDKSKCAIQSAKMTALPEFFMGHLMRFCRVKDFTLKNVTFRNPVVYGIDLTYIEDFTIENITFDYQTTKFNFYNNDGVHIEGNCKNGVVRNLKGRCYDDMLAITADDGAVFGDIENISVDGLFTDHCHSGIRFLSHGKSIKNITVKNIYGSFFKYCIGFTKYHGDETERGIMQNISIENVYACSCDNISPLTDLRGGNRPLFWVQNGEDLENITIKNVVREEKEGTAPLFLAEETSTISRISFENITQKNLTGHDLGFIEINGKVKDRTDKDLFNL